MLPYLVLVDAGGHFPGLPLHIGRVHCGHHLHIQVRGRVRPRLCLEIFHGVLGVLPVEDSAKADLIVCAELESLQIDRVRGGGPKGCVVEDDVDGSDVVALCAV